MGRTRAIHARLTRLKLLLRAASKKRRGVGENKTVAAVNLTDRTKPQMYFIRISFRNSKKFNQKLQLSLGEQYTPNYLADWWQQAQQEEEVDRWR